MIAPEAGRVNLYLVTAFSRDQKRKIYVQDRIREQKDIILDAICNNKATVIVCGSSGQMPKAVREALIDVLAPAASQVKQGNFPTTREEAEAYLNTMERQKRYLQETW
jgi:sulfite reductase alpha subunit-like flavoprotein